MLFNSYIFIFLFLPITLLVYWSLKRFNLSKLALGVLIIASFIFYGYQNAYFTLLLAASILINYGIYGLFKSNKVSLKGGALRKSIFIVGLLINIGILVYFKYLDFIILNVNLLTKSSYNLKNIILPLGISFYTFQQISFLIDSYKNEIPSYGFLEYALFVSFFPQLIAGPIVLHTEMVPQFKDSLKIKKPSLEDIYDGAQYFILGLSKKLLIADLLGRGVDWGYNNILYLNTVSAVFIILGYTMQIYFDFSGYCDMAIGLGRLFGFKITKNFDSPYKALSITEFWKRWHITLTRFFTTYLYIPLGGNRKGKLRTYINVMIVFTISGLWHGADWTFVLWGALHGIVMVIERIIGFERLKKLPNWFRFILTFGFINLFWILFRAETFLDAINILKRILHGGVGFLKEDMLNAMFSYLPYNAYAFLALLFSVILSTLFVNTRQIVDKKIIKPSYVILLGILFLCSVISLSDVSAFLYFNF